MTNLDICKHYFENSKFNDDNSYTINNEYVIVWLDHESFVVDRTYFDRDVGYVTDDEIFSGNFIQCLNFVLHSELGENVSDKFVELYEQNVKGL